MKGPISHYLISTFCLAFLSACGGGTGGGDNLLPPAVVTPPLPDPTGLWVQSEDDGAGLSSYALTLTEIAVTRAAMGDVALEAAPTADGGSNSGFSTTYTLESSVDEYDIVKYNGSILALAPSRSGCCYVIEPLAASSVLPAPNEDPSAHNIELFVTDPQSGTASLAGIIELEGDESAEGMYLSENRLQALISTAWWGTFGDRLTTSDGWMDQRVSLLSFDVSDPQSPAPVSELTIEGALVTSRRTGNEIHIVSRHAPIIEGLIPSPQTEEEVANNEAVLAEVTAEDVLPEILLNGEPTSPLTLDQCYRVDPEHPLALPSSGDSTLTTLLTVSAETGEILRSACISEPVSGVYMGERFMALTHVRWDLETGGTMIHVLERDSFEYLGSERVDGALYSGGNADFRISESSGVLRLVTTEWTDNPDDALKHRLFTLSPQSDAPELEVLGVLGDAEDSRIGKPNEDLYGVRFMADRAYMVTFERTDPLYVIDLSTPSRPEILGELEVPGFSDLLHEVSDALLLGLGSSERRHPKLELYNISDVASPISQSLVELGSELDWAYSPAQYNRYALTYLSGDDTDRLTVPYATGGVVDGICCPSFDRIALFEITGKRTPAEAQIIPVGEVSLTPGSVDGDTRVVLDSDALYVISRVDFLSGFWSNPEAAVSVTPD